jgi:CBS domain containing-hemolysin-like protein
MTLRFILLAAIVAINAFFAAAEVSLVAVRRSRLKELAARNSVPARAALELLANPERLLSLTQIGVTLASLGLGWAGEDTLYRVFVAALGPLITPRDARASRSASWP